MGTNQLCVGLLCIILTTMLGGLGGSLSAVVCLVQFIVQGRQLCLELGACASEITILCFFCEHSLCKQVFLSTLSFVCMCVLGVQATYT